MISRILAFIMLISTPVSVVLGQDYGTPLKDAKELSLKLQQAGNKTKTIICDFKQIRYMKALSNPVVSKGIFNYDGNNNIRLDYSVPKGNFIAMSNDKFTIKDNGKLMEINSKSNPMLKQLNSMLTACMTGDLSKFIKDGKIDYYLAKNSYVVVISPSNKRISNYLKKIILVLDNLDMTLNSMQMYDTEEDYTLYEFYNKKIN